MGRRRIGLILPEQCVTEEDRVGHLGLRSNTNIINTERNIGKIKCKVVDEFMA